MGQSLPPLPYTGPGVGTMEGCVLMLILCCYNRFEKNKIKPYPHIKSPRLSGKSLTDFLLLDFFFTILQLLLPYWHLVKINSENNFPKLKNIYILKIDDVGRKLPQFHVNRGRLTPGTGTKLKSATSSC